MSSRASARPGSPASNRGSALSTRPSVQSEDRIVSPRSTRCTSTSHQRMNGSSATGCSSPAPLRTGRPHTSSGSDSKRSSSLRDQLVASLRSAAASRSAPASISAARPSRPPSYWSITSDRTAASILRHIDSALRARCVRRWPTDQPGSFEARLTSVSPRSATTDLSRSCATRHPSMSARSLTVLGGRSSGVICILLLPGRRRRSSTRASRRQIIGQGTEWYPSSGSG